MADEIDITPKERPAINKIKARTVTINLDTNEVIFAMFDGSKPNGSFIPNRKIMDVVTPKAETMPTYIDFKSGWKEFAYSKLLEQGVNNPQALLILQDLGLLP